MSSSVHLIATAALFFATLLSLASSELEGGPPQFRTPQVEYSLDSISALVWGDSDEVQLVDKDGVAAKVTGGAMAKLAPVASMHECHKQLCSEASDDDGCTAYSITGDVFAPLAVATETKVTKGQVCNEHWKCFPEGWKYRKGKGESKVGCINRRALVWMLVGGHTICHAEGAVFQHQFLLQDAPAAHEVAVERYLGSLKAGKTPVRKRQRAEAFLEGWKGGMRSRFRTEGRRGRVLEREEQRGPCAGWSTDRPLSGFSSECLRSILASDDEARVLAVISAITTRLSPALHDKMIKAELLRRKSKTIDPSAYVLRQRHEQSAKVCTVINPGDGGLLSFISGTIAQKAVS